MANEAQQQDAGAAGELSELSEFQDILKQTIKPVSDVGRKEVDDAVVALVSKAMEGQIQISDDVVETIDGLLKSLDDQLTAQVNEILHHEEFQKIESAWRGLDYLVTQAETDATLRIKVINVSKNELKEMTRNYPGATWDRSPLHDKVYEKNFGTLGGNPFGCLIGDYQFDQSSGDVNLLASMAKIAEASLAPFISAASPKLLGIDNWRELPAEGDLSEKFTSVDYAKWNSLRDNENSRFVALTLPRVLAREPFGPDGTMMVEEFNFVEDTDGHAGEKYAWMNSAYAMGANIARAFKDTGWTVQIRGPAAGGEVANLPTHVFDAGGGSKEMKCPTEVSITDRREGELSAAGLIGLIHRQNTDKAAFLGGQSLYKPKVYVDDLATASDNMSARIPYMFAVSRFSHYLKCMVRDYVGQTKDKNDLQNTLQAWLNKYIVANPETANARQKAERPLSEGRVEVIEDELNPGYYMGKFYLKPHYQFEGMDIGMSLVSKLPPPQS